MKNSFILYSEYWEDIQEFSTEEKALLLDLIFSYVNGERAECDNRTVKFYFNQIKRQMGRDAEKWEDVKEQRAEAGKKGAEKRWNRTKPMTKDSSAINNNEQTTEKTPDSKAIDDMAKMANAKLAIGNMAKMAVTVPVTVDADVDVTADVPVTVGVTGEAESGWIVEKHVENSSDGQTDRQQVIKNKINSLFGGNISQELFVRVGRVTQNFSPHKTNSYIEWLYEKSRGKDNPRNWLFRCADEKFLLDIFEFGYQEPVLTMRCPVCNALHSVKDSCGWCGLAVDERENSALIADLRRKWGFDKTA